MPRAGKPCSTKGCPNIVPKAQGRCTQHQREAEHARRPHGNPYSTPGHTHRFRPAVLAKHPVCSLCQQAPSTIADHWPLSRTQLTAQGHDPNDPQHGRGLCKPCHDKHTARHQPGGWNNQHHP